MQFDYLARFEKELKFSVIFFNLFLILNANLSPLAREQENLWAANLIAFTLLAFNVFYFFVILPKRKDEKSFFLSTLVYILLLLASVHYTGSLQSAAMALVYIGILTGAILFGTKGLVVILGMILSWFFVEFFLFYLPNQPQGSGAMNLFWQELVAFVLIGYLAYQDRKEKFTQEYQYQILKSESQKLKEFKQREDSVFESITDMIFAVDKYGVVLMANRALLNVLGMKDAELRGKNYRDIFKIFDVDNSGNLQAEYDPLLTHEYRLYFTETAVDEPTSKKMIGKSGQVERYVSVTASPLIHQSDNEKGGAVLVMKDLTEVKELERMKLDFVSMAAHELRTPITAIRGYLSVLKEEATTLNEEHKTFIERVDIAAQQLANLMENLLSVSRIEKGTYTLNLSEVDWPKLVRERTEDFRSRAKTRNLELKLTLPEREIPLVFVDPLRIMEVLNNLLSNAMNYTVKGYVEVIVEYDQKKELVITHIKDTGPGIPKESQTHLFEKFFRVSGVLEQGSKGTGLGLFISKKIVELHNGSIWAESTEGQGSTFSFSLPISEKAQQLHQKTAVIPGKVYMAPPLPEKKEDRIKMPL